MVKCPEGGCDMELTPKQIKWHYKTRFKCRDCGKLSCFYCGDVVAGLCEECKEVRLE